MINIHHNHFFSNDFYCIKLKGHINWSHREVENTSDIQIYKKNSYLTMSHKSKSSGLPIKSQFRNQVERDL